MPLLAPTFPDPRARNFSDQLHGRTQTEKLFKFVIMDATATHHDPEEFAHLISDMPIQAPEKAFSILFSVDRPSYNFTQQVAENLSFLSNRNIDINTAARLIIIRHIFDALDIKFDNKYYQDIFYSRYITSALDPLNNKLTFLGRHEAAVVLDEQQYSRPMEDKYVTLKSGAQIRVVKRTKRMSPVTLSKLFDDKVHVSKKSLDLRDDASSRFRKFLESVRTHRLD